MRWTSSDYVAMARGLRSSVGVGFWLLFWAFFWGTIVLATLR